jgi:predicted acyltransferase
VSATLQRGSAVAPAIQTTVAPLTTRRERLLSLDVFRGITIAGMLLVNNPGTWSAIYPPLEHARWHGWTPTDLIFPFFLFIVGITTHLSLSSRRQRGDEDRALVAQVLRRGGLIVVLGLLLTGLPYAEFALRLPFGVSLDSATPQLGIEHWRITGVLQRIGVCYIAAALITLRTSLKQQVVVVACLLLGYWFAMTLLPVPGDEIGALMLDQPDGTIGAWLDRTIFGTNHLWRGSKTWDPEGVLSTLPAIGTTMLGTLAGRWIGSGRPLIDRIASLFGAGTLGIAAGLVWNWVFPINKNLWTSSYVVFTAGMACVTLATCMWLIDVHGVTWWTRPFVVFGVNPIAAYVGSGVLSRLLYTLILVPHRGGKTTLQTAIYQSAYASWLDPRNASLLFALTYVLLWLAIMWVLYRRNIFLKV